MVVGITGKYCSGKNRLASILNKMGFFTIDVDKVGHKILEKKKIEIQKQFGREVINFDGSVDRKTLGKHVFNNPMALKKLENILHPSMVTEIKKAIFGKDKIVINAAVLFSMGLEKICNLIILVKSPLLIRIFRGLMRDSLSIFQILVRIWTQRKLYSKLSLNPVDIYTITNIGNILKMESDINKILEKKGL